jgi:hypothetical protein
VFSGVLGAGLSNEPNLSSLMIHRHDSQNIIKSYSVNKIAPNMADYSLRKLSRNKDAAFINNTILTDQN